MEREAKIMEHLETREDLIRVEIKDLNNLHRDLITLIGNK